MVYHYGKKTVTSWRNITSRNAIESNLRSYIYIYFKIYSGLKYVFLKLFWNFWNVPVPDLEPSQLAQSWLPLIMFTVASSTSFGFPGYRQQCITWFHSYVYMIMQYYVVFDCTLLENEFATATYQNRLLEKYIRNTSHCLGFYVNDQKHVPDKDVAR